MIILLTSFLSLLLGGMVLLLRDSIASRRMNLQVERALSINTRREVDWSGRLGRIGEWSRRFYSPESLDHLRSVIHASGFNPHRTLPILLGAKLAMTVLVPIVGVLLALLLPSPIEKLVVSGVSIILGILLPDMILAAVRNKFRNALTRGTPDALDLLVVCSEAGMGLESAVERVATEMRQSHTALSSILETLLDDLRVLPHRRDAFMNLGTRSGTDGLRRLGSMLSQALQYGTPLSRALRATADELRRDRMNKLEEKAVKLPAKLIFPMIAFIMPSLYIILLGPSFMRLYDVLGGIVGLVH